MRYESGKTAKGNVGVSYVSQEKANEQAEIMDANGCTYCTDCTDCKYCTDCTDCKYCTDCTDCKYCTDCTGCTDCTDCKYCTDCTDCKYCTGCKYCTDCTGCKYCTDCTGCKYCKYFFDGKLIPPEQSAEALEKVRAIILDDAARLQMNHWHGDDDWKGRTCAEEAVCGTTHCLAGWLQVCSTDPKLRSIDAETAGAICAPVATKLFYSGSDEVLAWLKDREYLKEMGLPPIEEPAA